MSRSAESDAERVAASLEAIRRVMREAVWAEARRFRIPLTPQQVFALQLLVDHERETGAGLSLSELSERMGLAHSTVSGIVSRLETRQLVNRATDDRDHRFTRVELAGPVKGWLKRDLPATRLSPLAEAMTRATAAQRALILDGLTTLEQLITTAQET